MKRYVPISKDKHRNLRWKRFDNYQFASMSSIAPLTMAELHKAILTYPLAFVKGADSFQLVAVLSLSPNSNIFINENGHWIGGYIPSYFRSYPFRLIKTDSGDLLLGIDDESGMIGKEGEQFFDDNGNQSNAINEVLRFVRAIEENNIITMRAIDLLSINQCIVPWELFVRTSRGQSKIDGVFRFDHEKLAMLSPELLKEMIDIGALFVGYAQLFSMQNVQSLLKLAQIHSERKEEMEAIFKSSFEVDKSDGLQIDWSAFEK